MQQPHSYNDRISTLDQTRQMRQVRLVIVSKNSDTSVYKIGLVIGVITSHSFL